MTALLPCPFCGGKAEHHDIGNEHTKSRSTKIWCTDCRFSKNVGAIRQSLEWTRAKAIEAWNRRATPSPSPVSAPSPAGGVREAAEQVRYHWEVIQGQCSEGDGFTERAATDLELSIVALEAALSSPATPEPSYPARVGAACAVLFDGDPTDVAERRDRFAEEANEVCQAFGMTREDAHRLVDYTYSRPVGEPAKEIGAAMTTLAALVNEAGHDLMGCAEADLAKLMQPETIERIRAKRATRHGRGPLPGLSPATPEPVSAPANGEAVALRKIAGLDVRIDIVDVMDPTAREAVEIAKDALAALSNPAPGHGEGVPVAWQDVLGERRRQTEAEGWTLKHDDKHRGGELARAAACYAAHASAWQRVPVSFEAYRSVEGYRSSIGWPWAERWWKPTSPRRDLVKAGALILAEIERLDRDNPT